MTLSGHVDPSSPLAPRRAFGRLDPKIRALVAYPSRSLWEEDTAALPGALGAYRRRMRAFAEAHLAPRWREADTAPHGPAPGEVLRAAAAEGLLSDLLPPPFGSTPLRLWRFPLQWTQSLKMEELCAAEPGLGLMIGAHGLGSMPLLLSGDLGLVRRTLVPAYRASRRGDPRVFAFAITEPGAGSDVEDSQGAATARPGTVARRTARGWVLSGRKIFISGGDLAAGVTVFAALEGEGLESWTCFFVEADRPGYQVVRTEDKMGQRASGAAELLFDEVVVPDANLVGGPRDGWALNRATLDFSRIPVGAIALGIARGAVEAALELARTVRLGGRPLLDRQEVQLDVAGLLSDLAAMRAMVWDAGRRWVPTQARASMTKAFCGDLAVSVCERALELTGAWGLEHAARVEKGFRDARLTQIYEGTNQINRLAVIEDQLEHLAAPDSGDGHGA